MTRLGILVGVLLLPPTVARGATWYVQPDGLGDATTIQGGADLASPGDTVLVAGGTYHDCTHPDILGVLHCVILPAGVTLRGETGDPAGVTIDAQGQGRVVRIASPIDEPGTRLEGLTLTHGSLPGSGTPVSCGAGLLVYGGSESVAVSDCVFAFGEAPDGYGGGVYVDLGEATFADCLFLENEAHQGGGYYTNGGSPVLTGCRFVRNAAAIGGGFMGGGCDATLEWCVFDGNVAGIAMTGEPGAGGGAVYVFGIGLLQGRATLRNGTLHGNSWVDGGGGGGAGVASAYMAVVTLENTIVAGSPAGAAAYCVAPGAIHASCTDLWGNAGGDWTGCVASQAGTNGNLSWDPLFCASWTGDLRLAAASPCLPGNNDCAVLVGAEGEGCLQPVGVAEPLPPSSWAGAKSKYR